jgi:hypothetical protein
MGSSLIDTHLKHVLIVIRAGIRCCAANGKVGFNDESESSSKGYSKLDPMQRAHLGCPFKQVLLESLSSSSSGAALENINIV